MRGLVGVTVRVAVEARRAAAGLLGAAVLRQVELLLRERSYKQAQAFQLLGRDNAVKQLVIILDGDELALRDVAEVGALIEIHRRRELRQEVIGNVVLDVEAREIASLLPLDLVDNEVRKHEAACRMLRMGQRIESFGKSVLLANLLRAHSRKSLPGLSRRELDANAFLHRLVAVHRDPCGGPIAQVVPLVEKRHVLARDFGLLSRQSREDRRERLIDLDLHIARLAARALLCIGEAERYNGGSSHSGQKFSEIRCLHGVLLYVAA